MGRCLQNLMAPNGGSDIRRLWVKDLEKELDEWNDNTPSFFRPTGRESEDASEFYQVYHLFER